MIKRIFLLCLVYVCALHHIPPELVVNADETGVLLVPCLEETFGEKGSDQVSLQGFGEKRQFTVLFGVSASGNFAGRFQVIWNTLPKQGVMDSFKEYGFHDISQSHCSVEDTIRNFVTKLHDDHLLDTKAKRQILITSTVPFCRKELNKSNQRFWKTDGTRPG